MNKYLFGTILFFLFLFSCQPLSAGSCAESYIPLFIEYSRADAVFVGKIKRIKAAKSPKERKGYYESWKLVEFEVQKVYKGFDSSTQNISLFYVTQIGDDIVDIKKNQTWIIFAGDLFGTFGFDAVCGAAQEIENSSDIAELEKEIFSVKDKQAVVGRLYDYVTSNFIKDIEVILEGNGIKIVKSTDEKGMFYFPVNQAGQYKITINLPLSALYSGYNYDMKSVEYGADKENNLPPTSSTFTYEVDLKKNNFPYETIPTVIMPKKRMIIDNKE